MNRIPAALFFIILSCLALQGAIPRIAVFAEPGFPTVSSRPPEWFALHTGARLIGMKDLVSQPDFDLLIFPHGGFVPLAAEETIGAICAGGGTIIVAGDPHQPAGFHTPELQREHDRLAVQMSSEYYEFILKHGLGNSGMLAFNEEIQQYIAPVAYFSGRSPASEKHVPELPVSDWPNKISYRPGFWRPFVSPVVLNPLFDLALPPKITPPKVQPPNLCRSIPRGMNGDYAFDLCLPIYLFDTPSCLNYSGQPLAGKQPQDCWTDFYVYRRNSRNREGATFIVFGETGRILLEHEGGENVLREILKLHRLPLPGEEKRNYISSHRLMDEARETYNGLNQSLSTALSKAAAVAAAKEDQNEFNRLHSRLKTLLRKHNEVNGQQAAVFLRNKNSRIPSDIKQIQEFTDKLRKDAKQLADELAALETHLAGVLHPPASEPIAHPYQRLLMSCYAFGPWWSFGSAENWQKVASIGITDSSLHGFDAGVWARNDHLQQHFRLSAGYQMWFYLYSPKTLPDGILDYRTGAVTQGRTHVIAPGIREESLPWILRHTAKHPGIGFIVHGEEQDYGWTRWGEYTRERFIEYLKTCYQDITALNRSWTANYQNFSNIVLPNKRPESQAEHSVWEDWTRFREIYRIQQEIGPEATLVQRFAPGKRHWTYGSYHLQGNHPANGINYYELGKLTNPACLESNSVPTHDMLAYDIVAFNKKHQNTEWAAFYFPAGGHRDSINRMKDHLWNEATLGTIGWYLYLGGLGDDYWENLQSALVSPGGLIQPLGFELKDIMRDFDAARKVFLDGKRSEPQCRFLFSPTTRRHTSWPDIETDKPLDCVSGYHRAFARLHYPGRGIDEQAVIEGKLPTECKVLFAPQVDYLPDALRLKLEDFLRKGGTLVATLDTGKFNERGERRDWVANLAGVLPCPAPVKMIAGAEFRMFAAQTQGLQPLFPEESTVLLRYEDGTPAALSTRFGQGKLVTLAFPFGREYHSNFSKSERGGLTLLQKFLDVLEVDKLYECKDSNLLIRPYELDDRQYLALAYRHRRQSHAAQDGGFPLASAPALVKFQLKIKGHQAVRDYLHGLDLPVTFDGQMTTVEGVIANPGGAVYQLRQLDTASLTPAPASRNPSPEPLVAPPSIEQNDETLPLPYSGKLFVAAGKITLGEFEFRGECQESGGKRFFATVNFQNQRLRQECLPGATTRFHFLNRTFVIKCREIFPVMPSYIEGDFSQEKTPAKLDSCQYREEKFLGQNSLILENPYLFARLIPGLGGRIIELRSSKDTPNHLLVNFNAVRQGKSVSYRDYGGLELNPGAYTGSGWEVDFQWEVICNTPERIEVKMKRSAPAEWAAKGALKRSGRISYELLYSLERDSSLLHCEVRQFNELPEPDNLVFRTHPMFTIAGDCNSDDVAFFPEPDGRIRTVPYLLNRNEQWANQGGWYAYLDQAARQGILQTFPKEKVGWLYAWAGPEACNVEICYTPVTVPNGQAAVFSYSLGLLNGLKSIDLYSDGIAAALSDDCLDRSYGHHQTARFNLELASTVKRETTASATVISPEGKRLHAFPPWKTTLTPDSPRIKTLEWNTGNFPDGTYRLQLDCGTDAQCHLDFRLQGQTREQMDAEKQVWLDSLARLQEKYRTQPDHTLRLKIFTLARLCQEWENATGEALPGIRKQIEELLP